MSQTDLVILDADISLYEKQLSREEVAKEIGVTTRTLARYMVFGAQYIPDLKVYVDDYFCLNRRKFDLCHVEYMREISDLLRNED